MGRFFEVNGSGHKKRYIWIVMPLCLVGLAVGLMGRSSLSAEVDAEPIQVKAAMLLPEAPMPEALMAEAPMPEAPMPEAPLPEDTLPEVLLTEEQTSVQETVDMPAEEPEVSEYTAFAIADVSRYVNVRSMPSTDGEIIGKIYDGAVAQILESAGEQEDWYRIISGNVEGYIKAEFFIAGEAAAAVMDSYVVSYARVVADKLNVRAEASTEADPVGYLLEGEEARVLEQCGEWLRVQYTSGEEGYVAAQYVMLREDYSYAMTLEEAQLAESQDAERRGRKPVVKEKEPEEILQIVPPAVTYSSNEELRKQIVEYALQFVGNKYINGGSSLTKGTDCSGFTCYIYRDFGYSISRTPSGQYTSAGRSIEAEEIQPGDIICYSSNGGKSCTHVALYIGEGQIVHAANSRKGVITGETDFEPIIGIKNVID